MCTGWMDELSDSHAGLETSRESGANTLAVTVAVAVVAVQWDRIG